ncbi:LysM peptidoglycan-binding domain-containing protein [Terrilactibacillus sp. S3-3]|nr:LysM peptidoglycan-binding domain-containing protein [Terrilactibacillus sp. S3-3]
MNKQMGHSIKGTSYLIVLIILIVLIFGVMAKNVVADGKNYETVTVKQGDTLWSIAKAHRNRNAKLSTGAFVQWMERENGIADGHIEPHQKLFIPVHVH